MTCMRPVGFSFFCGTQMMIFWVFHAVRVRGLRSRKQTEFQKECALSLGAVSCLCVQSTVEHQEFSEGTVQIKQAVLHRSRGMSQEMFFKSGSWRKGIWIFKGLIVLPGWRKWSHMLQLNQNSTSPENKNSLSSRGLLYVQCQWLFFASFTKIKHEEAFDFDDSTDSLHAVVHTNTSSMKLLLSEALSRLMAELICFEQNWFDSFIWASRSLCLDVRKHGAFVFLTAVISCLVSGVKPSFTILIVLTDSWDIHVYLWEDATTLSSDSGALFSSAGLENIWKHKTRPCWETSICRLGMFWSMAAG